MRPTLREFGHLSGIEVWQRFFGSGGHIDRPSLGVTEAYRWRAPDSQTTVKSIVNPRLVKRVRVHQSTFWKGLSRDTSGQIVDGNAKPVFDRLKIHHYWSRSIADLHVKVARGDASTAEHRKLDQHLRFEKSLNEIYDDSIEPIVAQVRPLAAGQRPNAQTTPRLDWIPPKGFAHVDRLPVKDFRPNRARRKMTWYERLVTRMFNKLYYDCWRRGHKRGTSPGTLSLHWFGHEMIKCPMDLWVYEELITEMKPDWVIETGTYRGGSALYLASILTMLGHGNVVTIDPYDYEGRPEHPRIRYLKGSSTDHDIQDQLTKLVGDGKCLVILDSDHSQEHVAQELQCFSRFVNEGGYLIVEDTNVNGHPVYRKHGPGPMEAVRDFLAKDARFKPDDRMERFLLTQNPRGYLRREAA